MTKFVTPLLRRSKKLVKAVVHSIGYEIRELPRALPPGMTEFLNSPRGELQFDPAGDPLKAFATRAAQFSASADETRAIRGLHLSGVLRGPPLEGRIGVDRSCVGIWRRTGEAKDAAFVRGIEFKDDWQSWADQERIGPKRCKRRVVLIGESVARGYLYDPGFTPASALEAMLRSHLGAGEIDVIDLAKTNQTLQPLKVIIAQCLALKPDAVAIFAGNNWRIQRTDADIPYVDGLLREGGVPAMKFFLETRREQAVRQLTSQVNALLGANNIAAIWVVPEFNLGDWADPASNAPLLAGEGNSEWRCLDEDADEALRARDLGRAEESAKRMVELDGGTNAVPSRILAECCRSSGDLEGARRYKEMCRDAEGWDPSFAYSPRVSSAVQNALRGGASGSRNVVIDLPDIFSRHLDGALPDRRIFLDYCHLTAEGINVAMAAVASAIVSLLADRVVPLEDFQRGALLPSAKVEGQACLLAAIHNAHFYQGHEIVHHWCARALRHWPECRQLMTRVVDFQTRRAPVMACKSGIELLELGEPHTLRYLTLHGKRLDMTLAGAVVECLGDTAEQVADLRAKEHSTITGPKELTEFYYSSAMAGPSERAWTSRSFLTNRGSHRIYAAAFWETSRFVFFAEAGRPVGLKLTSRVPNSSMPDGHVGVQVNGQSVAQAPAGQAWNTLELSVLGTSVLGGMNEIIITWPNPEDRSADALGRAADTLIAGGLPSFYRIFGEIHSLVVSDPPGLSVHRESA